MRAPVVLAATHHDPTNAMLPQALRVLPHLHTLYTSIVMLATPTTGERTMETLRAHDVRVEREPHSDRIGLETVGLARQQAIRLAAELDAEFVQLCDWDRVLHWAELYPDELRDVADAIPRHDLLILGRTPRAFATHPRVQRDTETIVNHTFGLAFGQELDVTAASRGLSHRSLDALLSLPSPEPTIGNDCAWPLYLARFPELVIGYAATEGLEWETPDRYADEIGAAGGLDAWIANFDARPEQWEFRMQLALHEVAAINRWR
jgi:hypothetical protein